MEIICAEDRKDYDDFQWETLDQLASIRCTCESLQQMVEGVPAELQEKALQYWANMEYPLIAYESEMNLLLKEQNLKLLEMIGKQLHPISLHTF